jgi:hypothetical protein
MLKEPISRAARLQPPSAVLANKLSGKKHRAALAESLAARRFLETAFRQKI